MLPANSAAAGRITRREKLQPNLTAFTSYSEPSPAPRAHFKSATDGVAAASAALTVCRPAARIVIPRAPVPLRESVQPVSFRPDIAASRLRLASVKRPRQESVSDMRAGLCTLKTSMRVAIGNLKLTI